MEGFAFGERADVGAQVGGGGGFEQAREGFGHGFAAEAEGAVVHGDHGVGFEVADGLECFLGTGVDGSVAIREVGADGEQREGWREAAGDFVEAVEVGGVAGVVDGWSGGRGMV